MRRTLLSVTLFVFFAANQASAAPVIDQENWYPANGSAALAEGFAVTGQTITAGITGHLVQVDIEATRSSFFLDPWRFEVYRMGSDHELAELLSSTIVTAEEFPDDTVWTPELNVTLATPVFLQAGEQFAIVLYPDGVSGYNLRLGAGSWDFSGGYEDGTAFVSGAPDGVMITHFDLHFRTWVVPVPEPSSLALASLGALALAVPIRRRG